MDTECKCLDHLGYMQSKVNKSLNTEYTFESLLTAIRQGKTSDVHQMFAKLKTDNISHIDHFLLLKVAILQNMVCIVEYLLFACNNKDLNKVDKDGCSLIYWALTRPSRTFVEQLLQKGVDVNLKSADGVTALHCVVSVKWIIHSFPNQKCDPNFIETFTSVFTELLIRYGADINCCNIDGYNALHIAVKECNYDAVRILLAHKADVNCGSSEGTSMHIAVHKHNLNLVQMLLYSGASISTTDTYANTSLHHALRYKCYNIVHLFLDSDKNVSEYINALNDSNETALHVAIQFAPLDVIKKLIHKGADPNSPNYIGNTPLFNVFLAIQPHSEDACLNCGIYDAKRSCRPCSITKIFLSFSTDISIRNIYGCTVLHQGLTVRKVCTMKILLNTSINTELLNELLIDLLHFMTKPNVVLWLKLLVEYGADVNCKINCEGETSLHKIVKNAVLQSIRLNEVLNYLKTLLDLGADINSININGETPLHLALISGSGDLSVWTTVKLLLDNGANMFIRSKNNQTALDLVDLLKYNKYNDAYPEKLKEYMYSYALMYSIAEWPLNCIHQYSKMADTSLYTECKNEIIVMKTIRINSYLLHDLINPNNFRLLENQDLGILEELDKYLIDLPKYSSIIKAATVRAIVRKKRQQVLDSGILFLNKVVDNYKLRKGALRDCYGNILKYLCFNDFKNLSKVVNDEV